MSNRRQDKCPAFIRGGSAMRWSRSSRHAFRTLARRGRGARPDVREEFHDGPAEMSDEAAALNGAAIVLQEPRFDADPADAISEIAKPYVSGCRV
jgi:hypothetical protein